METAREGREKNVLACAVSSPDALPRPAGLYTGPGPLWEVGQRSPRSVPDCLRKQVQFSLKVESSLTCLGPEIWPWDLLLFISSELSPAGGPRG